MSAYTNSPAQGTPAPAPGVVFISTQAVPVVVERYRSNRSIGLGIGQLILGCLSIIFEGCSYLTNFSTVHYIGTGYWNGAMLITAGSLGIAAGKSKTISLINGYMAMSIIGALCSGVQFALSIIGAATYSAVYYRSYYYYDYPSESAIALDSCLAIFGFAGGLLSILAAAYACKATCACCGAAPPPIASVVNMPVNYSNNTGQILYISPMSQVQFVPQMTTGQQPTGFAYQAPFAYPTLGQMQCMPVTGIGSSAPPATLLSPPPYTSYDNMPEKN